MNTEPPVVFVWKEWDWRPLVRIVVWLLLAAAWARTHHTLSFALLRQAFRESLAGFFFTFGLLTYVQALVLAVSLRVLLEADAAAYAVAQRAARRIVEDAPFATSFAATFCVELALVLSAAQLWRTAHLGARFAALLSEVLR